MPAPPFAALALPRHRATFSSPTKPRHKTRAPAINGIGGIILNSAVISSNISPIRTGNYASIIRAWQVSDSKKRDRQPDQRHFSGIRNYDRHPSIIDDRPAGHSDAGGLQLEINRPWREYLCCRCRGGNAGCGQAGLIEMRKVFGASGVALRPASPLLYRDVLTRAIGSGRRSLYARSGGPLVSREAHDDSQDNIGLR